MADQALSETPRALKVDSIYGLADPVTGEVRYIGKSNNPTRRFKDHLRQRGRRYPVYQWIESLRQRGLTPGLVIIEASPTDWREAERRLIAEARGRGDRILNVADGGDQPALSRETCAANGRRNARATHDDPLRRRVWEIKKTVGSDIRAGLVSNTTRAKMRYLAFIAPQLFGKWRTTINREEMGPQRPDYVVWGSWMLERGVVL